MDRSVSMAEAKSRLAELVGKVAYAGERFVLERHGRRMAVLIGVDEYERLKDLERAACQQPLSPELRRRQEVLLAQARRLEERLGDPVDGLAELLRTLPAEDSDFWLQLAEEAL